jgi:hypothetical protein
MVSGHLRQVLAFPGYGTVPISQTDAELAQTTFGFVGGADIGVHIGRGVAVVGVPRIHWIARERVGEYIHIVPNAARVILSIGAAVQWWPRGR